MVDANDKTVVEIPQNVDHPGVYDEIADQLAHKIADAVNKVEVKLYTGELC